MSNCPGVHDKTRHKHQAACCDPVFDWNNQDDFEAAARGLIHRPGEEGILAEDGSVIWHHKAFEDFLQGDNPESVHPSLWRHALLNNFRGLFKVTDGVYQVRGESLANVTFVETDTGYIVIDPLTTVETAAYALNLLYEHVGKRPVVAVIYSHTHSDHFGGVKGVISEEDVASGRVRVIAPEGFLDWVLREQGMASEGMPSRNDYMYGERLPVGPHGIVDTGLGQMVEDGTVSFIPPTETIGKGQTSTVIDGVEVEFMQAPGESPVGLHCYFPASKTIHVADSCYMCMHNLYTIRGAFPRDSMQWADSIARTMAFTEAEFLVGGHNWPTFGQEKIQKFLGEQRDGIRYMHDQTLRMMNHGYVPSEIANHLQLPPSLERLWHLRGYYGSLKHNVQGIYAYYLGWYDGNPANLDRLPPREHARSTLDYMGGVEAVLERAEADYAEGKFRWVAHVLDMVIWAEPDNMRARNLAADAHTQMGYASENATWRNAYLTAAMELREGLPPERSSLRMSRDVLVNMEPDMLLNAMSIRLNGKKAEDQSFTVNWTVQESGQTCHSELSNSVLIQRKGHAASPSLDLILPREILGGFATGRCDAKTALAAAQIQEGDAEVLVRLGTMLDRFPAAFPVATHGLKFAEETL